MRVTSISATLIVLCILAVGCGAQEPQTQGVEKPKTEKAPEAPEKPQERVQKETEPQGAQKSPRVPRSPGRALRRTLRGRGGQGACWWYPWSTVTPSISAPPSRA